MKKILWIYTGGTIACSESFDENKGRLGLKPKKGAELSGFIRQAGLQIPDGIDVTPCAPFSLDSTDIGPGHWRELAGIIYSSQEYDGFIVTHGTDTMQYTSAALSLMLENFRKPVIITGSQKPFGEEESDAPFNFSSAFSCAVLISHGVYICFGGRIISGNSALKMYSLRNDAFADAHGDFGEVFFSEERDKNENDMPFGNYTVRLFKKPPEITGEAMLKDSLCDDVFYLKIMPGMKADITDFIKNSGYKGVVCEAYGLGGIQEDMLNKLAELRKSGIRTVVVSGCAFEGANLGVYNVGINALAAGIESGGDATGGYAYIRLMQELADN